ncbi:MAG: hypothetical protein ABIO71_05025 [Caldimonas sp.]
MATELPIPVEIPWQLLSTTQPLTAGGPAETTLSLFSFQPDDEDFGKRFPGQTLIFFKLSASISPATFPPGVAPVAATVLGEGIPVYHALLDMRVRLKSGQLGTIRPYFHDAAPLRREMIQTGVIGAESFSGESDRQVVGKSGSQMYESSSSRAITDTVTGGAMVLGIGLSSETTTTGVRGERSVTQTSDTTTRDASQERRELLSHTTKVENVLTLLSAKYLGTPYLRFSLAPRPLTPLSADSSDPSLWYGQLLQRRSSGIEGIQDFTMIVLVPKGEDFCISARLRRVCLLDQPPPEPRFDEPFSLSAAKLGRLLNYLYATYPVGTWLEDIDPDITGELTPPENFPRPVIEDWLVVPVGLIAAGVISTSTPFHVARGAANYKTFLELWLDTLHDEYGRAVTRSPLERGQLFGENRLLDTCFTFGPNGSLGVLKSSTTVTALRPLRLRPNEFAAAPATAVASRRSVRARATETVVRWNALDRRLAIRLGNERPDGDDKPGKLNDPRLVQLLVDRWAALSRDDPRNLDLASAIRALGLSAARRGQFKSAGATDLQSLAEALNAASTLEEYNARVGRRRAALKAQRLAPVVGELIAFAISRSDAQAIVAEIGDSLFAKLDDRG